MKKKSSSSRTVQVFASDGASVGLEGGKGEAGGGTPCDEAGGRQPTELGGGALEQSAVG